MTSDWRAGARRTDAPRCSLVAPWLLGALLLPGPAPALASPSWLVSPPLAPLVQRARSEGRLILIKVGTRWCPSCRKLDRILEEPAVQARLGGFLRLAYDAEEGEGKDVAERYNAIAFPTLLVVGGDGREVGRLTGELPGPELVLGLDKIRSGAESLARLEQLAAQRPDDLQLKLRVGTEWALRGSRPKACLHLDAVVAGDPRNRLGLASQALLAKGKYLLLRSLGDHAAALQTLRSLRARFPESREAGQALFPMAQALRRLGRSADALRLLEEPARTAEQHEELAWFCLRERTSYQRGLHHARRAVTLDPRRASAWANLAELQLRLGQRRAAEAHWARARDLDPRNPRTSGPLPALPQP